MNTTEQKEKRLTQVDLNKYTGDLQRYRHGLNPCVIYTPGIQFLTERAKCYWLIDAIASYFGSKKMNRAIQEDQRLHSLQFWRLDVSEDQTALLTARADSGAKPFITQQIPYTDFPLDSIHIWAGFDSQFWTLYLPSEH